MLLQQVCVDVSMTFSSTQILLHIIKTEANTAYVWSILINGLMHEYVRWSQNNVLVSL